MEIKVGSEWAKQIESNRSISRYKVVKVLGEGELLVVSFNFYKRKWEEKARHMHESNLLRHYDYAGDNVHII